ncbi:hypothetical protein ACOMHN_055662 [Nucella lapillus]
MKLCLFAALVLLGVCALVNGQLGLGASAGAGSQRMMNPMSMYMLMHGMGDPSLKHMPLMSVLMRNPNTMMSPMGAFLMSNIMGVDINKIATPLAMANGMGGGSMNFLRWMPLVMGDPNMMSLMFSLGAFGGTGMGTGMNMGGGMTPMY